MLALGDNFSYDSLGDNFSYDLIFTNPLSSNALARALHFIGAKAVLTRDELEDYSRSSQKGDQS